MQLDREQFEDIRDLIRRRCGIMLRDTKLGYLRMRLGPRLKETGIASCRDYCSFLRHDPVGPRELDRLIDTVAVHETYFFRGRQQLEDLVLSLPSMLGPGREPAVVWSAGCSTGDEAYTLAMLLAEAGIGPHRAVVRGSDFCRSALHTAREGIYEEHNLRYVPKAFRDKYFQRAGKGRYAVRDRLRRAVTFSRINLLDYADMMGLKGVAAVVCRNLIIYFEEPDRAVCVGNVHRVLEDGGLLFLGIGENPGPVADLFEIRGLPNGPVYRKAAGGEG